MQNGKLKLTPAGVLNIPMRDAQALLDAGDGDAALLYLYILRSGGTFDASRAATELGRSDRDIARAAETLSRAGVLSRAAAKAPALRPAEELPEYRMQDVSRPSMESEEFRALLDAVQQSLGRMLSSADVKKLFGLYDELALPADVILLLVNYCKERSVERYGPSRTVGFSFIEKEAYIWANREIVTHEQAVQWLKELARRRTLMGQLKRELGIRDREFTKTEQEYLNAWIDLGFPAESIAIAADRTITNTNGLKWKYMDSIIRSWQNMGIRTPEEIEAKDPRDGRKTRAGTGGAKAATRGDKKTMEQLDRLLASMETKE